MSRFSFGRLRWLALPFALALPTGSSAASSSADMDALLASTVCILGDVGGATVTTTGFVVPPGDQVITTAHGLGGAGNLRVKLEDGRVYPARLDRLGTERVDIAILGLGGVRLPPVVFGSIDSLKAGDEVSTIGCPQGFEFSVMRGVVSAVRGSDFGYPVIQTDVAVNPGSSGGPLVDRSGKVVGIVKGKVGEREGIHFALPIDLARALLDEVRKLRQAYELFNQAVLEPRLSEKTPLYRRVVALAPDLAEARYNLALVLERTGDLTGAEKEYREVVRLVPDHEAAVLNLGALLYGRGRFDDAAAVYRQALRDLSRSVRVRNNLAEAYRALGQVEEARSEFERILKQKEDYAAAHYGLAVLYDDSLRDRRRAAKHYRRYLALSPEAPDAERVREWLRQAEDGQ